MRIVELKEKILEEIKNQKLDTEGTLASNLTYKVSGIVSKLIKNYNRLFTTEENGNIHIRSWDGGKWFSIKIVIKKKKLGIDWKDWKCRTNYLIKDIEIETDCETIEGFIKKVADYKKQSEEYYDNKKQSLLDKLQEYNISFKEFKDLMNTYEGLNYQTQQELEVE